MFLAVITLIINACATPPKPITQQSEQLAKKLQQQNSQLHSWHMSAQVSLDTDTEHYSFNALWQQQNNTYLLQFDTLLSSVFMQIQGSARQAELRLKDRIYKGSNPEQLIAQLTPFNIPVTGLKYWIRGLKQPELNAQQEINYDGSIKSIQQQGWSIDYKEWDKVIIAKKHYTLPSDLELHRDAIYIRIQPSTWIKKQQQPSNPLFSDLE